MLPAVPGRTTQEVMESQESGKREERSASWGTTQVEERVPGTYRKRVRRCAREGLEEVQNRLGSERSRRREGNVVGRDRRLD